MADNVAASESIGSEVGTCSNPGGVVMDHSLPLTDTLSDNVAAENLSRPSEQDQQRHHHHPVQGQQRSSLELESQQQQPDREAVDSIEIGVDTDSNPEIVMDDHSLPLTDTSDNVVETRVENIGLKLSELGQQQLQQENPLLDQQLRHGKKPLEIQDAAPHHLATPKQPAGEQSQQQQPDSGGVKSIGIGIGTGLNSELVMVPSLSSMETIDSTVLENTSELFERDLQQQDLPFPEEQQLSCDADAVLVALGGEAPDGQASIVKARLDGAKLGQQQKDLILQENQQLSNAAHGVETLGGEACKASEVGAKRDQQQQDLPFQEEQQVYYDADGVERLGGEAHKASEDGVEPDRQQKELPPQGEQQLSDDADGVEAPSGETIGAIPAYNHHVNNESLRESKVHLRRMKGSAEEFVPSSQSACSSTTHSDSSSSKSGYNFTLNPSAEVFVPLSIGSDISGSTDVSNASSFNVNMHYNTQRQNVQANYRRYRAQPKDSIRRTIYVSPIPNQFTEQQVAALFVAAGQVVDCRIWGHPTFRFGFVEFIDEHSAQAALGLTQAIVDHFACPVHLLPSRTAIVPVDLTFLPQSETEKERCVRTVYCKNIDKDLSERDVKLLFEGLCGDISLLRLLGKSHHPTNIAFVEFVRPESAVTALDQSGKIFGSLPIRVSPSKTPIFL
ncbi:unnamed protein product [Calypogeia fissa]